MDEVERRRILDVLADRCVLVKLPEPLVVHRDENDMFAFRNDTCCDVRVTWSRQIVYDDSWMSISEARSLAAALLAAAAAAERAQRDCSHCDDDGWLIGDDYAAAAKRGIQACRAAIAEAKRS